MANVSVYNMEGKDPFGDPYICLEPIALSC